jgi:hypothetical protein
LVLLPRRLPDIEAFLPEEATHGIQLAQRFDPSQEL